MKDQNKTKAQLIAELEKMRSQIRLNLEYHKKNPKCGRFGCRY